MVGGVVRELGGVRIDTTDWPVVLVEFPEHRVPDGEFEAALGAIEHVMRECQARGEKCAQVTDITRVKEISPASQRRYAGEWLKKNTHLIAATSVGGATVTPSAILRGLITAVHWIHKPATPNAFVATRDEGLRYVIGLLDQAHVALPHRVCVIRERLALQAQPPRAKQSSWLGWPR
jgi:hypothetical protein